MKARPRSSPLAALTLSSVLLTACVASPDDVAQLSGEHPISQSSQQGLVEATVVLDGAQIVRGTNDFSVTLRAAQGTTPPVLKTFDASMAAHGHRVGATSIVSDGEAFKAVGLDLFMSGRWQVDLGVELDASSDRIEFSLDVP